LPLLNTYRMQAMALNASRYNLRNAEAATAYQAANLYHQQALGLMMENEQRARLMAMGDVAPYAKYDVRTGGGGSGTAPAANEAARDGMRDDRADGRVSVRRVAAARRQLAAYAVPAARELRDEKSSEDVAGFARYVQTLDAGLRALVAGPDAGDRAAGPAG